MTLSISACARWPVVSPFWFGVYSDCLPIFRSFDFLLPSCESSLCIMTTSPYQVYILSTIFSYSVGCLFAFLFLKKFFKDCIYFLERRREGEREGEKHQCVVASWRPPTGDLAHNPGTCPDWESSLQPFGSQAGAQSTEPHQPGLFSLS